MSTAARRATLVLLTILYGFGFADRVVIALVAQQLKIDFGISDLQVGLLGGTAFAIVNVVAAIPLARLADRTSRRLVVAGSLLAGSLFTALCGVASGFAQLITLRLGMAAGSAGTEAPSHALISDLYPAERRTSALSLFMLGVPLASIVGAAAGATVAERFGWRATFLLFGGLGILISFAALALMREPPRTTAADTASAAAGSSLGTLAALWRHAHFRHVLIGTALISLASFGVNTFLPAFFVRTHGLGIGQAGLAFGIVSGAASTIGTLIGGYGSERLARRNRGWLIGLPGLGLVIGAPLLLAGVMAHGLVAAVVLILIGCCFFYTAMGPAIAITHDLLDPRSRATGSALFLLAIHLVGQGLGPPLAGFASDWFATWQYGSTDFARACAGGAAQSAATRCGAASAEGLRYAVAAFSFIYLWASVHYALAARDMAPAGPAGAAVAA